MNMPAKVAIVRTKPETVVQDTQRAMSLAGVGTALDPSRTTILNNNLSWHLMYPSANTTPWQLEGAILGLRAAGLKDLVVVENRTVVTSAFRGEVLNKQRPVCDYYGVPIRYNFRPSDMKWQVYQPRGKMLVLDKVFPKGIQIPDYFVGKNVVHLPTVKCHIYTNITGALKNAFGGLLATHRHWCHPVIHGPGPRTMIPIAKNLVMASADSVAIDAVAAKMMGFDPMEHKFIRLAHEQGLGVGRTEEIELVGDVDAAGENWGFKTGDNAASSVGKLFWFGPMRWLQYLMFHTPIVYAFIFASAIYHDRFWYPIKGKKVVDGWLKDSPWGRLFEDYQPGQHGS
jgi:hypothetical protein